MKTMIDDHPVSPLASTTSRVHFPIDGQSPWVNVLRMMVFGSAATGLVVAGFLLSDPGFQHAGIVLPILAALLIAEFIIVRAFVIPRNRNYARFRITERRIELFPLTPSGLGMAREPNALFPTEYEGVSVLPERGGDASVVTLVHKTPAKNLPARSFTNDNDARNYAIALADALGLKVVS
ncbi:hypothetical protein MICA_980 [Micavibrio aeruginosavorus ARL-13]|uniref:DUF2244 domain-containing protein n=2 Tax=Micavibrio aeruginosavorus TaxID=349221 RepID=G2KLT2_MICAA|nr:hypothetical protein MICA_980 [Micavibrio aeruginosavorus ARL-13]